MSLPPVEPVQPGIQPMSGKVTWSIPDSASLHLTTGQLEMAVADVRTRLGAINTLLDERGPEEINPRRAAAPGRNCLVPEPVRVR